MEPDEDPVLRSFDLSNHFLLERLKNFTVTTLRVVAAARETAPVFDPLSEDPEYKPHDVDELEALHPMPGDGTVYLRASDHKYFTRVNRNASFLGVLCNTSVTGLLKLVFKEFEDSEVQQWAKTSAMNKRRQANLQMEDLERMTPDERVRFDPELLTLDWAMNRTLAAAQGTYYHGLVEDYYRGRVDLSDRRMNDIPTMRLFQMFLRMPFQRVADDVQVDPATSPYRREMACRTEFGLRFDDLAVTGQADMVFKVEGLPGIFDIVDWKFVRDLRRECPLQPEFKAAFPEAMPVLLFKYALQSQLYAMLFENMTGFKVRRCGIANFCPNEGTESPDVVFVPRDNRMLEWIVMKRAEQLVADTLRAESADATLQEQGARARDATRQRTPASEPPFTPRYFDAGTGATPISVTTATATATPTSAPGMMPWDASASAGATIEQRSKTARPTPIRQPTPIPGSLMGL